MNPKHPAIDRIEGPHDDPVAWTKLSRPVPIMEGQYYIAQQYAIPIEPYAEAILEPQEEVFQ